MSFLSRVFGRWSNRLYSRGMLHYNRREYAAAADAFEELLSEVQDPSNPDVELARFYSAEAHAKLGRALFLSGDLDRAATELEKAAEVERSWPDLQYFLGVIAARRDQPDAALERLDASLELNPHYAEARAYRALVLESLGRSEAATRDLTALAELDFPLPAPVQVLAREPRPEHLLNELRETVESRMQGHGHLSQAIEFYDQGALESALDELTRAVEDQPTYPDVHCRRGQVQVRLGQISDAVASFDRAVELNPDYLEALLARGIALLTLDRPERALTGLRRAAGLQPDYADVAYYLAKAAFRTGRFPEAVTALARALTQNPRFARARFLLGQVRIASGERDQGLAELRTALEGEEPTLEDQAFLGVVSLEAREYGHAVEHLAEAVKGHPEYPDLRLQLGLALMEQGRLDAARTEFEEAARLNPDFAQAHLCRGRLEVRAGRAGEAIAHLEQALQADPKLADAHCLLGEAWMVDEALEAAEREFKAALNVNGGYVDALLGMSSLRRRQGHDREARELLERVRSIDPAHPAATALLEQVTPIEATR